MNMASNFFSNMVSQNEIQVDAMTMEKFCLMPGRLKELGEELKIFLETLEKP